MTGPADGAPGARPRCGAHRHGGRGRGGVRLGIGHRRVPHPLDAQRIVLLAEVAGGAEVLTVVDAGGPAVAAGADVVGMARGRITVRRATAPVAPEQEPFERGRERLGTGLDRDQLARRGVRVQAAQDGAELRAVAAVRIVVGILGLAERVAQTLPHGLDRDRAVSLDLRGITVLRVEQGTVRDDHADIEGDRVHRLVAVDLLTRQPGISALDYYESIRKNPVARLVKIADILDNTDTDRLKLLDAPTRSRLEKKYPGAWSTVWGPTDSPN